MATIDAVRKKDFFALVQPLQPRIHSLAICLLPDDLQAQQLVIDAFTLCLLKEKNIWLMRDSEDMQDRRKLMIMRKQFLRSWIAALVDLGGKRAAHLQGSLPHSEVATEHPIFYSLELRTRAVAWLRFRQGWGMEEVMRTLGMKRYEVLEKIHNARFLLAGQPPVVPAGAQL